MASSGKVKKRAAKRRTARRRTSAPVSRGVADVPPPAPQRSQQPAKATSGAFTAAPPPWVKKPDGWHGPSGVVIRPGGVGYQVFRPGRTRHVAAFCQLNDAVVWVAELADGVYVGKEDR